MPDIKAFFKNFSVKMPLHKKIYLFLKNNLIKIKERQTCCGNYGEPGC